jgi:hypothetical protein
VSTTLTGSPVEPDVEYSIILAEPGGDDF